MAFIALLLTHGVFQALKHAYEDRLFACLDEARAQLGVRMDEELVVNKGRIMRGVCECDNER